MASKKIKKHGVPVKTVVYSYHGIVKRQTYIIPRIFANLFKFNWFKRLFFTVPAVDESIVFKSLGNNKKAILQKGNASDVSAEVDLGTMGIFKSNWEINTWLLEALLSLPVHFNAVHGLYFVDKYKPRLFFRKLEFDLTEPNPKMADALKKQIEVTAVLGDDNRKKVLVFHPLPLAYNKTKKQIIDGIVKLLKPYLGLLKDSNVYIAIENLPKLRPPRDSYFPLLGSANFFEDLMDAIDHPNVGITFDWGHANSFARFMFAEDKKEPGFEFTPETLATFGYQSYFLKKLKPKIYHLHINFNEAHKLKKKQPRFFITNFDSHMELTKMGYFEYENYKKNIRIVADSPNLISATLELMPRSLHPAKPYEESVKVFKAMLK